MDNRYVIAEQNGMSREFADWFFDNKKADCGDVWFMMMAAMWEGWKGRAAMPQVADGTLTNEGTRQTDELVMWVKRLAHSLRKANPDSKLQNDAMEYLSRKGLIRVEDVLR